VDEPRRRPLLLTVLDGWGLQDDWAFNAVTRSGLSNYPGWLQRYPWRPLIASGEAVGLPEGQMGNSEVGHLTLGAGRIIFQELPRISRAIADGSFFENPVLEATCQAARGGTLHLMGLFSDGGVHSHIEHLKALVRMAKREGLSRVAVHAITDGRDTPPQAGARYLADFLAFLKNEGVGEVATVIGRYYAMDRDRRWDRVARAYAAFTEGEGEHADDLLEGVRRNYAKGVTDEFIAPLIGPCSFGRVSDGDAVLFFNFRADRGREITRAFCAEPFEEFPRRVHPKLATYATMTRYQKDFTCPVAFETEHPTHTMGEVVSERGMNQLRAAETEKYAHVTFFFNGGREAVFPGEDRVLIPSPKVATYDLQPEMSARELTDAVLLKIDSGRYDFILLNFANPDMVGHTGDFAAASAAARTVDECLGRLVDKVLSMGGAVAVTADHGNLECMREEDGVHPHTAHTTNRVPFIWISGEPVSLSQDPGLGLSSVAPTLLNHLGVPIPAEMTGKPLFGPRPEP
jgi:2,3-bisphosphoglycerate-independent phosphoglycerate mutase